MGRTFTGPPPRTKLPPGSIDTQMHMAMPGFPAAPGCVPLPPAAPGPEEYLSHPLRSAIAGAATVILWPETR